MRGSGLRKTDPTLGSMGYHKLGLRQAYRILTGKSFNSACDRLQKAFPQRKVSHLRADCLLLPQKPSGIHPRTSQGPNQCEETRLQEGSNSHRDEQIAGL